MNSVSHLKPRVRYQQTALVLQGGGALGSYQAGVYECLEENGVLPDWLAGISIGAINAAIIAGNPPGKRVERLRSFWMSVSAGLPEPAAALTGMLFQTSASALAGYRAMLDGVPGFFSPRFPPVWLVPYGVKNPTSFYDTAALRNTLLEYADFGLINSGKIRLSAGAVNIRTGNFAYFDTRNEPICPEHIMASGALPAGFPAVEIGGEYYWDGGLVSNTPLSYVLNDCGGRDTLVFQVDLFSARGKVPRSLGEAEERRKDIVYSSRTRLNTDDFREKHRLKQAITQLVSLLPPERRADPAVARLAKLGTHHKVGIVHLIHRPEGFEGAAKDFDFSRRSILEHWEAGRADAEKTLRTEAWREPPPEEAGIAVYDMTRAAAAE